MKTLKLSCDVLFEVTSFPFCSWLKSHCNQEESNIMNTSWYAFMLHNWLKQSKIFFKQQDIFDHPHNSDRLKPHQRSNTLILYVLVVSLLQHSMVELPLQTLQKPVTHLFKSRVAEVISHESVMMAIMRNDVTFLLIITWLRLLLFSLFGAF